MPERTCIGCGRKAEQGALVRLTMSEATVVVDRERRLGGRGAWLHPDESCLEKAAKRKALGRALRRSGATADVAALRVLLTGNARKD